MTNRSEWLDARIYWYRAHRHMSIYIPTDGYIHNINRNINAYEDGGNSELYNKLAPVLCLLDETSEEGAGRYILSPDEYWAIVGRVGKEGVK